MQSFPNGNTFLSLPQELEGYTTGGYQRPKMGVEVKELIPKHLKKYKQVSREWLKEFDNRYPVPEGYATLKQISIDSDQYGELSERAKSRIKMFKEKARFLTRIIRLQMQQMDRLYNAARAQHQIVQQANLEIDPIYEVKKFYLDKQ